MPRSDKPAGTQARFRASDKTLTSDFTADECRAIWKTFLRTYLATSDEALLVRAERQVVGFARVRHLLRALIVADKDLHTFDAAKQPLCR